MKVSIITPAYNAEKFIGRCLDHSLGQTYNDVEVIVVDDGSTDSTVDIVRDYVKRDCRLKLLTQNHGGPNIARKKALGCATGDYTLFVDADDYLAEDAVSILIDKLQAYKVDSIRFNARYCPDGELVLPILSADEKQRILNHDKIMKILLTTYCLNSLCMQIYKTDYIRQIEAFDSNIVFGEDFLVNLEYHQKTKRMLLVQDVLYYYCNNPKSTTRNRSKKQYLKNLSDRVLVSREAMRCASQNYNDVETINAIYYAQIRMIKGNILNLANITEYSKNDFMKDIKKALPRNVFEFVDCKSLNDYMSKLGFVEKLKNRGLVGAIARTDYGLLWNYIWLTRIRNSIYSRGGRR